MLKRSPIKRHKSLQPISREHHQGLLLSWKIKQGISKQIDLNRIKAYTDYFYESHLKEHFEVEEEYIFPVLGKNNPLIKKAMAQHRRLTRLFNSDTDLLKTLCHIEEELARHIRLEEREIFNEVQKVATPEQLLLIEKQHNKHMLEDTWEDKFWEY